MDNEIANEKGTTRRQGLAVASLVIGILSLLCFGLLFVGPLTGLILGIIAFKRAGRLPNEYGGSGIAIGGIVINAVAVAISPISLVALIYPFISSARRPQSQLAIQPAPLFQSTTATKLTNNGNCKSVVISLDGRFVVYAVVDGSNQSIWVKQVATGSSVEIVPPAEVDFLDLSVSYDGSIVYYAMKDKNASAFAIYQVPLLGGAARSLFTNTSGQFGISPDGNQLAIVREDLMPGEITLVAVNLDGTNERKLITLKKPWGIRRPTWSPDGRSIVCIEDITDRSAAIRLVQVRAVDGTEQPLNSGRWFDLEAVAWPRDSDSLIITGQDSPSSSHQIWSVSRLDGASRRIINDSNDYRGLSVTRDSTAFVTIQVHQPSASGLTSGDVILVRKNS